jgi:hypothetical protein
MSKITEYEKIMIRVFFILACSFMPGLIAFSQTTLHGVVRDNSSLAPLNNVNIKVNGTNHGVSTGADGRFVLTLTHIPASITITCVGYKPLYYHIDQVPAQSMEFVLRRQTSELREVEIKAMRFNFIYKDRNYSILDYELMGDNLLLLVFRYQLKNAKLILLSRTGDTLSLVPVPELKPMRLYKDFLGNIHYISTKENAFQCFYNDVLKKIEFPFRSTYDSLIRFVKPFLFTVGERLYFEEFTPGGFGKRIGYYDTNHRKGYIRFIYGETAQKNAVDDLKFNARWNEFADGAARFTDDDYRANQSFYYQKINAPMVKLGDNEMVDFNFTDGIIEFMNKEGKVYRTVPIEFHKEADMNPFEGLFSIFIPVADWRWSGKIYVDEYYQDVYTTFRKNGMVQVRKINLQTGKLTNTFDVPFPFPEKIEIYKGEAFFLNKDAGGNEDKWKLVKLKL